MKKILLLAVMGCLMGCSVVGPGNRGIRVSLGTASDDVKEPGAYVWIPFLMGMTKINVQVQRSDVEASAASKDMQEIKTHVAVNWAITPEKVVETFKNIGDEDDVLQRIIEPSVSEVFKAAISQKTAEEVLGKRMELKAEIDKNLKERLSHYGVNLSDVSIVNLTFSKEFTDAIEEKQIAEQGALKAKYTAQKAIEDAKAEVYKAEGQAKAQNLLRSTLTPDLLQKMAIERWDGKFPQVIGTGTMPFLNMKM